MLYTYTVYKKEKDGFSRVDTTTRLEELSEKDVLPPFYVEVYDNTERVVVSLLNSPNALEDWQVSQERSHAWKSPKRDSVTLKTPEAVKPTHYKNFIDDYQWLDAMSRIHRYEDPEVFKGAVELQIRKYLDRNGKKDSELQELMKGLFYYLYLVKYIKNNNKPILAVDIHNIMENV